MPPEGRKALGLEHKIEDRPADKVKGFAEIELSDNGRYFALVTRLYDISSIDKIFRDAPSLNKARLIIMD